MISQRMWYQNVNKMRLKSLKSTLETAKKRTHKPKRRSMKSIQTKTQRYKEKRYKEKSKARHIRTVE